MSVYSTSLKQVVFEARQFSQRRCEFRLDRDAMYFSNLRLVGLGCAATGGADLYNKMAGAYTVINRITLLDGAQELGRLDEANRYLAWYNQLDKNENNKYVNQRLAKHSIGYRLNDVEEEVESGNSVDKSVLQLADPRVAKDEEEKSGWLDLRKVFPILNALGALDASMMPNLRIVIEWEQDARKILVTDTTRAVTIYQPVLVADEIVDDSMKAGLRANMKDVSYKSYEHDVFVIPEGTRSADQTDTNGVVQSVSETINGFDNKYLHRVVLMKSYVDLGNSLGNGTAANPQNPNRSMGGGAFISRAQHREKVNFVVNGGNLLTGEGLDHPSVKADLHDECWGSLNIVPNGCYQSVGLDKAFLTDGAHPGVNVGGNSHENQNQGSAMDVGQSDYIGVRIEERISDFQVKYERRCLADELLNKVESAALEVHIYGEVPKAMTMDGRGSYTIQYL